MPDVLDWLNRSQQRALVERAVQELTAGQLVVLPTEAGYCLAAFVLAGAAVAQLAQRQPTGELLALALASSGQAPDWVPDLSPLVRRLARRCWPGPLVLVLDPSEHGLTSRLPLATREQLCPQGQLALTVPDHEAIGQILSLLPAPLVLAPLPASADGEGDLARLAANAGVEIALLLDAGCRSDQPLPTVVRIDGQEWQLLREGAIPAEEIARKTTCVILFVCTGNTCRSPMAEALCKQLLADRLGCQARELVQHGYLVLSAGLAALPGDRAAAEAVTAVEELGAALLDHASRPLTADLVELADHVLTMTAGHQAALAARYAPGSPPPRLLDPDGGDVSDPVGAELEVYRDCARQIKQHLERFVAELFQPTTLRE